jgi:hypothetical protein
MARNKKKYRPISQQQSWTPASPTATTYSTSGKSSQISGAMTGAAAGAAIGSVVPVVSTGIGGLIGGIAGYFGSKKNPKPNLVAPEYIDVQTAELPEGAAPLGQVTRENLQSNLENLPLAQQLVAQSDQFSQNQLLSFTEQAMPGFRAYQEKLTQAGMERLEDPYSLPKSQEDYLKRKAAIMEYLQCSMDHKEQQRARIYSNSYIILCLELILLVH